MKAIILAAGRGSRMKDLTEERPKCLVELRGKALLDWQLEALRVAGITEIAIVTGYKRELLANRGLVEFHNERWAETNMVSSLACAQAWLQAEPCIVSYSDIFYSPEAVKSLIDCQVSLAVTYDPNWLELWTDRFGDPLLDAETFRLTPEHTLAEIGNKPKTVEEVQGQYMGLLRFTPEGWAEVVRIRSGLTSEQCDKMYMTGTLQKVIEAGSVPIYAVPYEADWGEVDSADDLAAYETKEEQVDFAFLVPRPEFVDFINPVLSALRTSGSRCITLTQAEISIFIDRMRSGDVEQPKVVVSTNEIPEISAFTASRKVLIGHSLFIRDTIPTPLQMGAEYFIDFDYFFVPTPFYMEWTMRAILDVAYYFPSIVLRGLSKCIIPGGYVKELPPPRPSSGHLISDAPACILYVPSVFSPEHSGHKFHADGCEVISRLAESFPDAAIICRPHPTDRTRSYVVEAIAHFSEIVNVKFDLSPTPSPSLYSEPDVVITDMSGFAFVHELITKHRPVFFIDEAESAKHDRFIALAKTYGHVANNIEGLVDSVRQGLLKRNVLEGDAEVAFDSLFNNPFNNVQTFMEDLIRIKNGGTADHWISLPITFANK